MADYQGPGYHGNLDFWGNQANGSPWWNQDMSDAGQGLYQDPNSALQAGTIPKELLMKQQVVQQEARQARGGFIGALTQDLGSLASGADQVLRNVVGDDATNIVEGTAKALWWPIDKAAQGAYWAYSNVVSQPLSTVLLKMGKAEQPGGEDFFGGGWGQAYHEAENVSPAQALVNMANVEEATGKSTMVSKALTGFGATQLTPEQKEAVKRNTDRFLVDSEYWRKKQGWTYTAGTGSMDFALSMGADPAYAGLKFTSAAVKGARSVKIVEEGEKLRPKSYGINELAGTAGEALGRKFAKTPEEASRSESVNNFFDWAVGKSQPEIRQHPIWGSGRRVNPEADRLSEVFSQADRDQMPLLLRYAAKDNDAAIQLATQSRDLTAQVGKLSDNRVLINSVKLDPEMLAHFKAQEAAGQKAISAGGTSPALTTYGKAAEAPVPRPVNAGPAQEGWDKLYGQLEREAQVHRMAASSLLPGGAHGLPKLGTAAQSDIQRATEWQANQIETLNTQLDELSQRGDYLGNVLGQDIKHVDDYSPGESNLFGSMSSLYRMGPLALKDTEKAASKRYTRLMTNPSDYGKAAEGSNFVVRTLRNGFYAPAIRMVHSLGDRVPMTFVDHTADDAPTRVAEMLKSVKGLDPEARMGMLNWYTQAGDKVAREQGLSKIHSAVIEHMASQYAINPQAARVVDEMIRTGTDATIAKLTGQTPTSQEFSAAGSQLAGAPAGKRADMVEDGDQWVVSPLAKTQLSSASPLLDVKELDKFFKRNSTFITKQIQRGSDNLDAIKSVADSLNSLWKAGTLLRPGYILRSMSEEQAASAVKFGVMSLAADSAHGGWNWVRNRGQSIQAELGLGSYGSTLNPSKATIRITDPDTIAAAKARQADIQARMAASTSKVEKQRLAMELKSAKTTRIKVNDAWPVVQGRLTHERDGISEAQKVIDEEMARPVIDQGVVDAMHAKIDDHKKVIDEFTDYADEMLFHAQDSKGRRLGEGTFEFQGRQIAQAFNKDLPELGQGGVLQNAGWDHPIARDQVTSHHANASIFARSEAIDANRLVGTGNWKTIMPDDATHMTAWLDALNKQFRQDDLFKLVAEDPTLKKASTWLNTPAGRRHRQVLGLQGRDAENLLSNVKATLDTYLPQGTGLQEKLAKNQEIAEHELRGAIDQGSFPPVHGEDFLSLTRKGQLQSGLAAMDRMIEKGFKALGTVPNDVMARQPIYLRAQQARMGEFIDQELSFRRAAGKDDVLDPETMNKILAKSDKFARKDISQVVYDPTRTTASEALRFFAPFMAAHMDGLERWGGLVAEKPEFIGAAAKIYNAPVAANLVTDQSGNHVDQNGYADVIDPTTGKVVARKFVPIEDRVLNLKVPDGTRNVRKTATLPIKMSALNTILPGDPWWNPGTGPYAQIAASQIAKEVPQLGDFMQWAKILPYGPSQNWYDPIIPKQYKDAWNAFTTGSAGNDAYQAAYLAEYQRQVADHANGGPAPDMKKVAKNAKQFMYLDALSSFVMPAQQSATPLTGSPYQFFLDQYKVMQEVDPKNAKTAFFQKYGEDYFAFTASLSKSMGIQATQTAENTANKFGDLIASDPSLAGLIVGDVYNQGKFSSSVYRKQMDELIGGERVREKITAEQAINENKKDMGWQQYGQLMGSLDAELIRSGFQSYNQMGAQPFMDAKRQITELIAQDNDAWFEDYGTTSTTKIPIAMKTIERMVNDKELMADASINGGMRDDLTGLAMYIQGRKALQDEMAQRRLRTLSFDPEGNPIGQAADIGYKLKTLQLYLVNNSLGFGDVFHRYLENDDLS